MAEASLVRTVGFRARHRYGREEWSEERNRAAFGAQVDPHFHDWSLEVTVRGALDEKTGFVVDLPALDDRLRRLVGPLDQRELNDAIPEVGRGAMMPSTEALARWFWERLVDDVPGRARLVRVRVAESDTLAAVYEG